jgi:hypothetical protein
MRDEIVVGALVIAFALIVTTHAMLAYGLTRRVPWWRGPVALVVLPLAPYWGFRSGMRIRSTVWVTAAVVYAVVRWLAAG